MKQTLRLDASREDDIAEAARLLRAGGLVAFATETVYGLGADATCADAVQGIFRAKQRPSWDPLIVHLPDAASLGLVADIPAELRARIQTLADRFWPGPLTLLLPRTAAIPDAVTAGRALVGVRVPRHPAALDLLRRAGVPVAAPSANRFGHTSPTTATHVLADLEGRIDAVLDAGATQVGVESTVLDPTQTPMMLYRPGAITADEILRATGVPIVSAKDDPTPHAEARESLASPGMGMRHYAPDARVRLVSQATESRLRAAVEQELGRGLRVGVLLPSGWSVPAEARTYPWAAWGAPEALAQRLFDGLRVLEAAGAECIVAPVPDEQGIGAALRDRLEKAARS